jgi:phosphatidylglycerophosphate synthase
VVAHAGARRIKLVTDPVDLPGLRAWQTAAQPAGLLVVRADNQVVHTPLLMPLLQSSAAGAWATADSGHYAGALYASAGRASAMLEHLVDGGEQAVLAAFRAAPDCAPVEHGPIARYPVTSPSQAGAAARYLEQIVHKPQDGPVTRWLYRPVSVRLTRLLLRTPVSPNQISFAVAALGALGVYATAHASYDMVVLGSAIILVAAYLDGCDGEVARLKVRSSRFGAWLDTITDEFTTVGYMAALGYHNYLRYPQPWVLASILFGLVTYLITIYAIYYYLIVVHGSANSQDYVDRLEIVPGRQPGTLALKPLAAPAEESRKPASWADGVQVALYQVARRDFINWGALVFALAHWTDISYALMLLGGAVTAVWLFFVDHLRLRRQIRHVRQAEAARRATA